MALSQAKTACEPCVVRGRGWRCVRHAIVLVLPFVLACRSYAVHVRMELAPEAVEIGESADLAFIIEADDVGQPAPPELPEIAGLRVGRPSVEQTFSRTEVNGVLEHRRSTTYRFRIVPLQPGEYVIGPFAYEHDGEVFELPARTLRVVAPRHADGREESVHDLSDLVFATLEVDRDRVYIHEPFTLTLAIYSRELNLGRDVSLMNLPDTGISTQPFQELRPVREIVGDRIYDVRRYQTQIRPLTSGTIHLAPELRIQVLVQRSRERGRGPFDDPFFRGFFSNYDAHPIELSLDPVEVIARPIPAERPASYTGGVGSFDFSVRVQPKEVRAGDPITLTIMIEGEGNMDAVAAPSLQDSDLFRVYPPRLTNQDLNRALTRGRKLYEQVIIPRTEEAREVPPLEFSYFDPRRERFETVVQGPFELAISPADPAETRVVRGDDVTGERATRVVGHDIMYLMPAPNRWANAQDGPWYVRPTFLALQTLPPALVLAVLLFARRRRALDADVALARRYRAPRSARRGLRQAEQALRNHSVSDFHDGVWLALTAYFGNRLNLPPGSVTVDEVQRVMREKGMDEKTLKAIGYLFADCEHMRFARGTIEPGQMRTMLEDFRNVLKACERVKT